MNSAPTESQVVGISPWLPWPFSAWSCWTTPVRAERLALLRIGFALVLLGDILCTYAPDTIDYFGNERLADTAIFNWRFDEPRMTWSLLRGVGDPALQNIAIVLLVLTTIWILWNSGARLLLVQKNPPEQDRSGVSLWIWTAALAWYTLSIWSQMIKPVKPDAMDIGPAAWLVPLAGVSLTCLFCAIELASRLRDPGHRIAWFPSIVSFVTAGALLGGGTLLALLSNRLAKDAWWVRFLGPWQSDNALLLGAMVAWITSAGFLLIGFRTRFAAVLAWMLAMSFANVNTKLDNAGDTIRLILLFYLMICPCGAAWSIDSLWKKRSGPAYVHPWPICLIVAQMIFMYWMNGLYKLFGETWREGSSLHYVLGDLALARFSRVALPLPFVVTQIMTWTVLAWEVLFPFTLIFKWPRRVALFMGVMFHLGIFVSLELGPFALYAICMYLPLLPLEWWLDRRGETTY
ncbi:MAG TPA: HTTM domain-containing protein [Gemmataceae bacterium]|nr:HTTM domain-containing protein [Gemmataceae bacterium]